MAPIFIIGTERSGTNLLRLILDSHSGIAVPHPPHIMRFFGPLAPLYGDLGEDANFRRLIGDVCRMVELHPYPWEMLPDRETVFLMAKDRTLISIYFAIYDQYLAFTGKRRWACKSTFMLEHVAEILRYHADARFIFMVRDGRDVAVSAKESIFNDFHVFYSAKRWRREQRVGLSWLDRLPADQIMLLRYEDLISDCDAVVRTVCRFLEEPFEVRMLEHHRSAEAKKSGGLSISWENTARPVIRDNAGKFRSRLSAAEVLLFEAIAFEELKSLGYPLTQNEDELISLQKEVAQPKLSYRLSDTLLRMRAEARHLAKDRNAVRRLEKMLFLTYLRLRRGMAARHA